MLKNGEITPEKLNAMSSEARVRFFAERFGGEVNGKVMERQLESKFLNKNVERGIVKWAENLTNVPKEFKQDLMSKIQRMSEEGKLLDVARIKKDVLNELVEYRTGKKMTDVEINTVVELSKKIAENEPIYKDGIWSWESESSKMEYARSKVALRRAVSEMTSAAKERRLFTAKDADGVLGKMGAGVSDAFHLLKQLGRGVRQLKAGLFDVSMIGRQVRKTYRPGTWDLGVKTSFQALGDFFETLVKGKKHGQDILDAVEMELLTRQDALNGRYSSSKGKIDIGLTEESTPQSFLEKVPFLGRTLTASRVAAEAQMMRVRADVASRLYEMAEKNGANLGDPIQVGAINELVNSMTGRGKLKFNPELQETLNDIFFSPKFIKSQLDTFTQPFSLPTEFARKQALWNLTSLATSSFIINEIAHAINPDSTEIDPTSSDFGKIKIGNTRYDITGGNLGFPVLFARIASTISGGEIKSSTTGVEKEAKGYGAKDWLDFTTDFAANKTSPLARFFMDVLAGETFDGEPVSVKTSIETLFKPIILETYQDAATQEGVLQSITATLADFVGVGANTYVFSENWGNSTSQQMEKVRSKVSDEKFSELNERYNKEIVKFLNSDRYKNADNEGKIKMLDKKKRDTKEQLTGSYQ